MAKSQSLLGCRKHSMNNNQLQKIPNRIVECLKLLMEFNFYLEIKNAN
jgi:hypothetical protein